MVSTFQIRYRCRTRTTCQVCQAIAEVSSESSREILADTLDTAANLGQTEVHHELILAAVRRTCPECGAFHPIHIGRIRMRRHAFLTASVVIALCVLIGLTHLFDADQRIARMIGCTLALAATLGQIAIAKLGPSRRGEPSNAPTTIISPAHFVRRPLPGLRAYHVIAFAATLLAGPVIVSPSVVPRPPNEDTLVRLVPGEVASVEFPDEFDAVGGYWYASSPKVNVLEPKSIALPTAQLNVVGSRPIDPDWEPDANWLANAPVETIKPKANLTIGDMAPLANKPSTVRLEMTIYFYPRTSRSLDELRRVTVWKELRIASRTRQLQDRLNRVPVERLADFLAGLLILSAGMLLYDLAQQAQQLGSPPNIDFDETAAVQIPTSDDASPDAPIAS